MQSVNSFMPGYEVHEYLLILQPHEELQNRIHTLKKEFARKYKAPLAELTKPYVPLVSFATWAMAEEKLLSRLQAIAMGITPFKIELQDFGSLPTHTIYINLVTKLPVKVLIKELKEAQRLMKLNNDNKPHFMEEPHITICPKLKPWQYEAGWLEYSHRRFTGRFIADNLLLLKRPVGTKAYQIVKRFEFQNLPATTRQGDLFGLPTPSGEGTTHPVPPGGGAQARDSFK
jgi:2'-5' RNA ligase